MPTTSLSRRGFIAAALPLAAVSVKENLPEQKLAAKLPQVNPPAYFAVILTSKSKRFARGQARVAHVTYSRDKAEFLADRFRKAFGARFVSIVKGGAV